MKIKFLWFIYCYFFFYSFCILIWGERGIVNYQKLEENYLLTQDRTILFKKQVQNLGRRIDDLNTNQQLKQTEIAKLGYYPPNTKVIYLGKSDKISNGLNELTLSTKIEPTSIPLFVFVIASFGISCLFFAYSSLLNKHATRKKK